MRWCFCGGETVPVCLMARTRVRTQATADESFRGLCSADFKGHKNEVSNLEHIYEVTWNSTKTNTVNETHTQTTAKTCFLWFLSFSLMFSHLILKNAKRNVYNGEMGRKRKQKGALSWQFGSNYLCISSSAQSVQWLSCRLNDRGIASLLFFELAI